MRKTASDTDEPAKPSGRFNMVYLRAWREHARLSIRELASRAGVSTRSVLLAELGRRHANGATVLRYADGLDIPAHVLLTYAPTDADAREYLE